MEFLILFSIIGFESNAGIIETQVPFDPAGQIYEIDSLMAQEITFFTNYPEINKALLLRKPDSSYVIEIYSKKDKTLVKKRIPISEETRLQIKNEITKLKIQGKGARDRSGFSRFLGYSFIFAYGTQAPLITAGVRPKDAHIGVAIYMLSSAAGFFIPLLSTGHCDVSKAHAEMYLLGGIHGLYIAGALSAMGGMHLFKSPGAFITTGGSIVGEYMGFQSVNRFNLSMGRGHTIFTTGDFSAVGAAAMLGLFDNWENHRFSGKQYLATSLVGLGGGMAAGVLLTKKLSLDDGDPIIFQQSGIVGGLALPVALSWVGKEKFSENAYIAAGLVGLGLGSAAGYKIIRNRNFTESEGNIICLGGYAGALTGVGIAYLTNSRDSRLYWSSALIGDVVGSLITAKLIKAGSSKSHSRLQFHPETAISLGLCSGLNIPSRAYILSFTF